MNVWPKLYFDALNDWGRGGVYEYDVGIVYVCMYVSKYVSM